MQKRRKVHERIHELDHPSNEHRTIVGMLGTGQESARQRTLSRRPSRGSKIRKMQVPNAERDQDEPNMRLLRLRKLQNGQERRPGAAQRAAKMASQGHEGHRPDGNWGMSGGGGAAQSGLARD